MLIDKLGVDLWPNQRDANSYDYSSEQKVFLDDISEYLRDRFRIIGKRIFVIPPNGRTKLTPGPFLLGGPAKLAEIHSWPAFAAAPSARNAQNASGSCSNRTFITVGVNGHQTYTAIALHAIPDSSDELLGYFELEPLSANPMQGL